MDDISTKSGKQLITVVTKNSNYFYLIIDRDDKGNQTVHFLNQVDEEDIFNLMDEEDAKAVQEAMNGQKVQAEETAEMPEPTKEPEEETTQPAAETVEKKPANQPDPDADYPGRMRMATIFPKRRIRKKTMNLKTNKTIQAVSV